jgi:Icc-related predicted phosphoesterase
LRLHILSDLHLETDPAFRTPFCDADVLILAGDIAPGIGGLSAFANHSTGVVYVPGNHEYYDADYNTMRPRLREFARQAGIHLLDCDEYQLGGVRFLGTTLWTDFRVYGDGRLPEAFAYALPRVVDFRAIQLAGKPLVPRDTIGFNADAVQWLGERLDTVFGGPTVVVTHHAPHPLSIHPRWHDNLINPAFVSDLSRLMGKAALWVHGHTHDSSDYQVLGTRVICNPKGYGMENKAFRPDLVVTL